jgi:hypothetical protein
MCIHPNNRSSLLALALVVAVCAGCRNGLPGNFSALSLDGKIKVYGRYLEDHVHSQESARLSIASYGGAAATRLEGYLEGRRSGFPALEAIAILQEIQETQCTLRGSSVPQTLQHFLKRKSISQAEFTSAKVVLDEIGNETTLSPCKM